MIKLQAMDNTYHLEIIHRCCFIDITGQTAHFCAHQQELAQNLLEGNSDFFSVLLGLQLFDEENQTLFVGICQICGIWDSRCFVGIEVNQGSIHNQYGIIQDRVGYKIKGYHICIHAFLHFCWLQAECRLEKCKSKVLEVVQIQYKLGSQCFMATVKYYLIDWYWQHIISLW